MLTTQTYGRTENCPFAQWVFTCYPEDNLWTEEEMNIVGKALSQSITTWQQPSSLRGFRWWESTWEIRKMWEQPETSYVITKVPWPNGLTAKTVQGLAEEIARYFAPAGKEEEEA